MASLLSLPEKELRALLLLNRTPGVRTERIQPFLEAGENPSEILERIKTEDLPTDRRGKPLWKESLEATSRVFDPAKELSRVQELGINLFFFRDEHYPALLREASDPPLLLYVRGELFESDQAALAIVGSRHPSLYGIEQAKRFSKRLAELGLTIVSGFARGIDREAHEAALEVCYGRTLAVLGSGLDVIYPKEHQALYEEVLERGALISEFALGTPPLAENFPRRNRIIAGLSLGVFVVEAHSRSGSLITARLAAEEGREVFALPGRVDQLGCRGTHGLIREGASLVEFPEEIFEALNSQLLSMVSSFTIQGSPSLSSPVLELEEEEFLKLFQKGPMTLHEIIQKGRHRVWEVGALLTQLELKGVLRKRLDGCYEKIEATCI